jgi:hypothetical protein
MIRRAMTLLALGLPMGALAGVTASSEGSDSEGDRLSAKLAVDGKLSTAWAEGADGDGVGEWLEITLDRTTDVKTVSLWPGKLDQGSRGLREYGRPHTVTITLSGGGEDVTKEVRVLDIAETGPTRLDVPIEGKARKVRVTLDQVYGGGIRSDTYLTEVAVNFVGAEAHPAVERFQEWRASTAGERVREAFDEELSELTATIAESEFGERDLFARIKLAASDGVPAETKRAMSTVPDGQRMRAVPPSRAALNALLQLDDPNAVAALELAATRTTGELSEKIADRASRFRALAELKGGNRRNVKPFGESGWCTGCLRGFGEPLAIAADGFGSVWIADIANNRVQQMGFDGIVQSSIGQGEPQITANWFGSKRPWYASANEPSQAEGGFVLPVAIATLPDKAGDSILVLDAAGRIQHLTASGKSLASWKLDVTTPLMPRVGGEAHLAVAKNQVIATWQDTAFVFDLEGEQLASFALEDGVPEGLVGFKNGKFGVLHRGDLIRYSADGFRYGGMLGDTVPQGGEFMAVAMDEAGKLWLVTDVGLAIKYKKPGKVDYQVMLNEFAFDIPRIDVYQDLVFVTDGDTVKKYDALQMHQAAKAAEE